MWKDKPCLVTYRETYDSMGKTVFEVIKYICREKSYSYEELKKVFPDEIANHGSKFVEHPCVIKEENEAWKSQFSYSLCQQFVIFSYSLKTP